MGEGPPRTLLSMPAAFTKLEAVNDMLAGAGFAPVSSLNSGGPLQAVLAEQELDRQVRRVLSESWWFNREIRTLTADAGGTVLVPSDVLRIEEDPSTGSTPYFERAGRLWSRTIGTGTVSDTFTANGDVSVFVVVFLEWDDIPFEAQDYALAVARKVFQVTRGGDRQTERTHEEMRLASRAVLIQAEGENSDANILLNPSLRYNLRPDTGFNRYDP